MATSRSVSKGTIAGLLGGIAGAWVMNQFQGAMNNTQQHAEQTGPSQTSEEPATVKTARSLANLIGAHLDDQQASTGGEVAHYAMGAVSGAVYGALAEWSPVVRGVWGTAFGGVVWLLADEVAVPAFGLSKPVTEYPLQVHASALASHVVFGIATELVRRGLRAMG